MLLIKRITLVQVHVIPAAMDKTHNIIISYLLNILFYVIFRIKFLNNN